MTIAVADTSPLHYLLLIEHLDLLPRLFGAIAIPEAVRAEMLAPGAPVSLRQWMAQPPTWLSVQAVTVPDDTLSSLDPGERAAIVLAETLPADLLIIDERLGRRAARDRDIPIIGTIGILDDAAAQGWIDLPGAIARLQQTNFRISRRTIQALLQTSNE